MTVIQIEEQVVDATLVEQPDVAVTIVEGQSLPGPAGVGVPTGGTTGDFIRKLSDADFDTGWSHPDFVTSVATRTGDVVLGEADITGLTGDLAALVQADTDETSARAAADTTNANALSSEAATRASADTANATAITNEATARASAVSSEASTRAAADTTNANAIAAEVTRATAAEATKVGTSDSRLSDARTPTAHHTTHESGGTDAVTLAQSQITGLVAALAALQPLDSDLTAIAALSTTSFGRALLALADAAALRSAAGVYSTGQVDTAIAAVTTTSIGAQPLDSDLTAIAALTTTSFGRAFLTLADAAAALTAIGAVATTDSRLTDARTPAAHHATHESGGTDAVTLAQSQVTGLTTALAGKSNALTRTTVKTSAYTAAAGDLVPVDTTSGAVTITLPTAPVDKTRIAIKHIIQGGTNAVTYQCGGSDVLNKASGVTSGTLPILAMSVVLEYQSSTAIWSIVAGDTPVAQLDLRYPLTTDARLSDTRTPTDNSVTSAKIVDGTIVDGDIASANKDGLAATPSLRTLGTGSTQAAAGNDARLSDTRTPTDGTVTTAKIAAAAVTYAKLQNVAANSVLGNNTGSAASAAELTAAQLKTLLAIATGDVSGLGTIATHAATEYALLLGVSGGQTLIGGTGSGDALILQGSSAVSKAGVIQHTHRNAAINGAIPGDSSLYTAAANSDPLVTKILEGYRTTTDATVSTILNMNGLPASDCIWTVNVEVWARRTGGSAGSAGDVAYYGRIATFKNIGGTLTQVGTTTALWDHESVAAWDVTCLASGNIPLVRVTGVANTNITWHARAQVHTMAS